MFRNVSWRSQARDLGWAYGISNFSFLQDFVVHIYWQKHE